MNVQLEFIDFTDSFSIDVFLGFREILVYLKGKPTIHWGFPFKIFGLPQPLTPRSSSPVSDKDSEGGQDILALDSVDYCKNHPEHFKSIFRQSFLMRDPNVIYETKYVNIYTDIPYSQNKTVIPVVKDGLGELKDFEFEFEVIQVGIEGEEEEKGGRWGNKKKLLCLSSKMWYTYNENTKGIIPVLDLPFKQYRIYQKLNVETFDDILKKNKKYKKLWKFLMGFDICVVYSCYDKKLARRLLEKLFKCVKTDIRLTEIKRKRVVFDDPLTRTITIFGQNVKFVKTTPPPPPPAAAVDDDQDARDLFECLFEEFQGQDKWDNLLHVQNLCLFLTLKLKNLRLIQVNKELRRVFLETVCKLDKKNKLFERGLNMTLLEMFETFSDAQIHSLFIDCIEFGLLDFFLYNEYFIFGHNAKKLAFHFKKNYDVIASKLKKVFENSSDTRIKWETNRFLVYFLNDPLFKPKEAPHKDDFEKPLTIDKKRIKQTFKGYCW
jgi:hypothetical protein